MILRYRARWSGKAIFRHSMSAHVLVLAVASAGCGGAEPDGGPAPSGPSAPTTPSPVVTTVSVRFCSPEHPVWVAYQSGRSGPWTAITSTGGNAYTFALDAVGAVAFVSPRHGNSTEGFRTTVIYGTVAELQSLQHGSCRVRPRGSKTLTGTFAGIGDGDYVDASMGGAQNGAWSQLQSSIPFTIGFVPDGVVDLIAKRHQVTNLVRRITGMIVRRGLTPPNGSALATLDFNAAESFAPVTRSLSVSGGNGARLTLNSALMTANGSYAGFIEQMTTSPTGYLGVPSAGLAPGDLQFLFVGDDQRPRYVESFATEAVDRTVTLGAPLGTPVVTRAAVTPAVRPRMDIAAQSDYANSMVSEFDAGVGPAARSLRMEITAGYLGRAPSVWTVTAPDFTGAGGYRSEYNFAPSQITWTARLLDGNLLYNGQPRDGSVRRFGLAFGNLP